MPEKATDLQEWAVALVDGIDHVFGRVFTFLPNTPETAEYHEMIGKLRDMASNLQTPAGPTGRE